MRRPRCSRRTLLAGTVGSGLLGVGTGSHRDVLARLSPPDPADSLHVGAGEASLAWRAGARPGQVGTEMGRSFDRAPYPFTTTSEPGDGIHSEPTAKAIVLESGGERYALVKTDAYLFHELAHRRVADRLAGVGIPREHLLIVATHNHSAPHAFATGMAVGLFADSFDPRHWSYQTRQLATAVERAVETLEPATVRAVEGSFAGVQENVIGPATATEKAHADIDGLGWGTPAEWEPITDENGRPIDAGFPPGHVEDQIVLLRFDTIEGNPIAATLTLGMHPESLEGGHGLTSADFVGVLERQLESHVGGDFLAAHVMGPLGDIEPSQGGTGQPDWWRQTFGRCEELATTLGDEAIRLFERAGEAPQPTDDGGRVYPEDETLASWRTAGSHEPPARLDEPVVVAHGPSVDVDMAAVRLPPPPGWPGPAVSYLNQAVGSGGALPSTTLAQESVSPFLTALRIGDIFLGGFPGEPISDVSFNFRTRVERGFATVYQGYHWPDNPGWVRERIADNFATDTVESGYEIAALCSVGNAWTGYYVTPWEYENRNHYRQSLTPYGPNSAEHVVGTLVGMARELRGEGTVEPRSPMIESLDSVRRTGFYASCAVADESVVPGYHAFVRPDGETVGAVRAQPSDRSRFETASVTWVGGTNAVDVPHVILEHRAGEEWEPVVDGRGHEVVVTTDHPPLSLDTALARERKWTAEWEIPWDAPTGTYRFHVEGTTRGLPTGRDRSYDDPLGGDEGYSVTSAPFAVSSGSIPLSERYTEVAVSDGTLEASIVFEPERRAIERPADGTEIPVTLVGERRTIEVRAVHDTAAFVLEADELNGLEGLQIDAGAYEDGAGNPTEAVELEV